MTVLVVCKDLFFTARIGETGRLVGAAVEFVRQPSELSQKLGQSRYGLAIVDLTTPGWDYNALFSALETREPRPLILGFTTHVLAKATQPWHLRCDRVVTKETLTQELSDILTHGLTARPRA